MIKAQGEILSNQLVPGDVLILSTERGSQIVPCDILLLRGTCVVNESILTGESAAQVKYALQPSESGETGEPGPKEVSLTSIVAGETGESIFYDPDDPNFKMHTLFSGTELLQVRSDKINMDREQAAQILALVIRIGMECNTLLLRF